MSQSNVLLLTSCANTKDAGASDSGYDSSQAIGGLLPHHCEGLLRKRKDVLEVLRGTTVFRQGVLLRDLPYNAKIREGPDFGGDGTGEYQPAVLRYCGRFYTELGPDRLGLVRESRHHLLILSGLYGLLNFPEPIQAYSCHVLDAEQIPEAWKSEGFLTSVLLGYVHAFKIKRILDLTSERAYRDLLDWDRIRRKVEVLRLFGEQNAGPALLCALGDLTRTVLLRATAKEILSFESGKDFYTKYERVRIQNSDDPPNGFPRESVEVRPESAPRSPEEIVNDASGSQPIGDGQAEDRDIPVSSGGDHRTAFGCPVHSMRDLPNEVRRVVALMSRAGVVAVHLGCFKSHKINSEQLKVRLSRPKEQMGKIHGKMLGPFKVPGTQYLELVVTRGKETQTYEVLLSLLSDNSG